MSNETHDYGLDPAIQNRHSNIDALLNSQHNVFDPFSEHMIAQFVKI